MAHTIDHDEAAHRYVLIVDGQEAGFAAYEPAEGALDFNHTVVHEQFQAAGAGRTRRRAPQRRQDHPDLLRRRAVHLQEPRLRGPRRLGANAPG